VALIVDLEMSHVKDAQGLALQLMAVRQHGVAELVGRLLHPTFAISAGVAAMRKNRG